MRICRFNDNRIGVVRDDGVHDVSDIVNELPAVRYPYPMGDQLIANLDSLRGKMEELADGVAGVDPNSVKFLSPVANPTKVIGTPSNYQAHRDEMKGGANLEATAGRRYPDSVAEQGLFIKANSALIGPGEGVAVRFPDRRTDHEAELGLVFSKSGTDIPESDVWDYVAGYALALDMVVRGKEDRSFRKSVDTYAVLGPWLVTADEVPEPENLNFELSVNGESRQVANTGSMIMDLTTQISWGSTFYSFHAGDILMTGTCSGVGPVQAGDNIHMKMDVIGEMDVAVRGHG